MESEACSAKTIVLNIIYTYTKSKLQAHYQHIRHNKFQYIFYICCCLFITLMNTQLGIKPSARTHVTSPWTSCSNHPPKSKIYLHYYKIIKPRIIVGHVKPTCKFSVFVSGVLKTSSGFACQEEKESESERHKHKLIKIKTWRKGVYFRSIYIEETVPRIATVGTIFHGGSGVALSLRGRHCLRRRKISHWRLTQVTSYGSRLTPQFCPFIRRRRVNGRLRF